MPKNTPRARGFALAMLTLAGLLPAASPRPIPGPPRPLTPTTAARTIADDDAIPGHPGFVVPHLDLEGFVDIPIEDYGELRGMLLLLYEVPAHESDEPVSYATEARIARMGRFAESFGRRGLVALALIDANVGEVRRVAREATIRTPYCRFGSERGRDRAREALGWTLPDGVLVDPLGVLVDIDGVGPDDIQTYLGGAFDTPPWTWPVAGRKLTRRIREGEIADAWREAVARRDELPELADTLLDQGRQALAACDRAWLEGDALTPWLRSRRLASAWQDTPLEEASRTMRDKIQADTRGGTLRRVQQRVRELVHDTAPEPSSAARVLTELDEVAERHRSTRVGREARFWRRFYGDIARED